MFESAVIRHEGSWFEVYLTRDEVYPVLTTMDIEIARHMVMLLRGYDG